MVTLEQRCWLLFLLLLVHRSVAMVVRPMGTKFRTGPQFRPPVREAYTGEIGPRDVVLKLYDIGTPTIVFVFKTLAFKEGWWLPKLSLSVGGRCWSFDGEPEETYEGILERVSGGKALRTFNCGPTTKSDEEIDAILAEMAVTNYTQEDYDFFFRNCNHFALDLAERLTDDGVSDADTKFIDERVLHESEAILSDMPFGQVQQMLTRKIVREVQLFLIKGWRKEWKRSVAEYEEAQGIPVDQRIVYTKD
jgi:hypothetical protein